MQFAWLGGSMLALLAYCLVASRGYFLNNHVSVNGDTSSYLLMLFCGLGVLFLVCNFRDQLDFKSLLYYFTAGIFASAIFGAFVDLIPFLSSNINYFTAGNIHRYSALCKNPNHFHVYISIAIGALLVLDLKKQISWRIFYPCAMILFGLGLLTIARSFVLVIAVAFLLYFGLKIYYERRAGAISSLYFGLAVLAMCAMLFPYFLMVVARYGEDFAITQVVSGIFGSQELCTTAEFGIVSPDEDAPWDELDEGRASIWRANIRDWLDSPVTFLFGRGIDSPHIDNIHQHNIYIFILVKTGIVGLLLLCALFVAFMYTLHSKCKYKFTIGNLLILIIFAGVGFFELIFPYFCGFFFLFFYVLSLGQQKLDPAVQGT